MSIGSLNATVAPPPPAPPPPKQDAADKAGQLVHDAQHQDCTISLPVIGDHGCHTDTDGRQVGREIATLARAEPAYARAVLDKAMDKVPSADDRKAIAHGVTDGSTHAELVALAGSTQGRALLDRSEAALKAGSASDADKGEIARIDSARKASDLAKNPDFKKLDPATQAQVLDQIRRHQTDSVAVDNTITLATSAAFQSASPATQKALLEAQDHHADDAVFRAGLEKLAASPEFARLTPAQQRDAVRAFDEFANRDTYQGKEGSWFFNVGAKSVSDADKATILDNLAQVVTAPGFQGAGADTRKQVLDTFAGHATDAAFAGRLKALVGEPGFGKLGGAQQVELLKRYGSDAAFAAGVDKAVQSPAYKALNDDQKALALNALNTVAMSEAYRNGSDADKAGVLANATGLVTSAGYLNAAPGTRSQVLEAFGHHASDAGFAQRLGQLVNDGGFGKLGATDQAALLKTYGEDKRFAEGLDDARTTNSAYTVLGDSQRAQVLANMVKLSKTDSYKDAPDGDKADMVRIMADVADFCAANPGNATANNAMNQILDGHIKLHLYDQAPSSTVEYGHDQPEGNFFENLRDDGPGIYLNKNADPQVRDNGFNNDNFTDTLAHEVNHHLNGQTSSGTPDRFVDEYRAAIVGHEARLGRPLTASEELAVLDNLVGPNSAYPHLRELYNKDATFRAVADGIRTTLQGTTDPKTGAFVTPPATVSGEEARQRLIDGGVSSDYLKKPGNVDDR